MDSVLRLNLENSGSCTQWPWAAPTWFRSLRQPLPWSSMLSLCSLATWCTFGWPELWKESCLAVSVLSALGLILQPGPQCWEHVARTHMWGSQLACLPQEVQLSTALHNRLTTELLLRSKLSLDAFKIWSFARTTFIKNLCGNLGLTYTWTEL